MSGSVSRSKNDPSQSLQMIERPLMTPDELKSMPKGQFIVMKTGVHPMRVKLKLFYKWGIKFNEDKPYTVADNGTRKVKYANKGELMDGIVEKYHADWLTQEETTESNDSAGGQNHTQQRKLTKKKSKNKMVSATPNRQSKAQNLKQEVNQNGQT